MKLTKGWKTYLGAAALAVLGVVAILNGDTPTGVQHLSEALALVGLRAAMGRMMAGDGS
mgnify:CR=1 FL=1